MVCAYYLPLRRYLGYVSPSSLLYIFLKGDNYFRYHGVSLILQLYIYILFLTQSGSTLYSMAKFAGLRDPVTLDFERSTVAYCVDAFSISMGALVGVSPVTAFVESATGISGKLFLSLSMDLFH